jgi:iron complex outermembrane recepter protein
MPAGPNFAGSFDRWHRSMTTDKNAGRLMNMKRYANRSIAPNDAAVRRRLVAGLLVVIAIGLGNNADAQQSAPTGSANAESQSELGEIVVTAEKRSSTVQTTPLSVTALSGEQLQAQGITNIAEVAGDTPGISMRTSGPGQTELEMRGMASSGGSSPTVGFYLDETPLTPPAASLNGKVVIDPDLFDLNRVEVLRGPQGTLYGSGSMGGTIRLITNAPELNKFSGSAEGILSGTQGAGVNPTANFMLNLPIIDDTLALRVVGTQKYVSGWVDRIVVTPFPAAVNPCAAYSDGTNVGCTRGNVLAGNHQVIPNVNWEWMRSGRMSLLAKPSDALTINATLMYQKITSGGYSEYDSPPGPEPTLAHYQPFDTAEPFSDTFWLSSLTVNYDMAWATLTSNTSFWSRRESQSQDISEALRSDFGVFYGVDILTPVTFTEIDYSHQASEELRLASNGSGPFNWLLGVFYSKLESVFDDINQAPAFAPVSVGGTAANPQGQVYDAYNPYYVTQYAGFGEASYKFTDQWKLTLGLRYFHFSTIVDESQQGALTASGNATPTLAHFDTTASGTTPKVNLGWFPDKDLTVYASASKGFRPGGVNLPLPPFCQATQETYRPDSSWDYEVGEKARMFDNRISLNADVYYIRWSDVQQLYNQSCGYSLTTNVGDAKSYGPELELTAHLTPQLTLTLNGAYTKAYLTSINPAVSQVSTTALTVGTPILNIPKYTESTSLTYAYPLNDEYKWVSRIANSYVGPSTDTSFTYVHLSPYDLVTARTGVDVERWSAFFFIDNLTNKVAQLSTNTTSFSWIIPSLTRVATNQPRTFGIDVSYHF